MQQPFPVLWTVVNLIDGEADWFFRLLGYLLVTSVITYFLRFWAEKLIQRELILGKKIRSAIIRAIYIPLCTYTWVVMLTESVDLISDRWLSSELHDEVKLTLAIGAVLFVSWTLLRFKKYVISIIIEKKKELDGHVDLGRFLSFSKLITLLITLLTALILMELTDVNVKTIIAFGGISGLAIAFASQEIIANFFWGMMIHINRTFSVGEEILLPDSNIEGKVEDIGWCQTRIRGPDKRPIYIPNTLISKVFIINTSRMTHRRLSITISIRHEDVDKADGIIHELRVYLDKHTGIDSTEPLLIYINSVGSYSIDIAIAALTNYTNETEFFRFRDQVYIKAVQLIKAANARLALPVQELSRYSVTC